MVGLLPILGATEVPSWITEECPDVTARLRWLQRRRPELMGPLLSRSGDTGRKMLLSLVDPERLRKILARMFDTEEFLSPFGIRSLSAACKDVVTAEVGGQQVSIDYEPGESRTGMFGGNSNWRGPIWFPVNVLLADKLRTYGRHFGDSFQIEIPTGSGNLKNLVEAADIDGRRPDRAVPAGRRATAGGRQTHRVHRQPALARASDVQRVLRRRHRRGSRRHPSDRLDRAGCAPAFVGFFSSPDSADFSG